jgi:hypothetical protein
MDVWMLRKALKELDIDPNEERLFKLTHYKMGDYAGYIGNYLHLKANC